MNSGDFRSRVGRGAVIGKFLVLVLLMLLGAMPMHVLAKTSDGLFFNYLKDICGSVITPPAGVVWDGPIVGNMCSTTGAGSVGAGIFSINLGMANAGSGAATRKKKTMHELIENKEDKESKQGASADSSRWGFLVTPQYGNSNRIDTDFENGYQSNLKGVVLGLDYRFSDSFVLGSAVGLTKDNADFINGTDSLKTSNNTITLYGTWLVSESTTVDGYLGYGKLNLDSQRHVGIGLINGYINGSTSGQQNMAGIAASYLAGIGRFDLSPFINFDYIKTRLTEYNESGSYLLDSETGYNIGTDNLALHFDERSVTSLTSSLGLRMGTSYGYDWGALQPFARIAAVHEYQNKTRQLSNELVITPGAPFMVETDEPDRNYLNIGLGVSAALNGGTQLFLDYDKRTKDELLSSWAVSLGALMEF